MTLKRSKVKTHLAYLSLFLLAGCANDPPPTTISGRVVEGQHLARHLGYPTANILLGDKKIQQGVYACTVTLDFNIYRSMCYTGFPNHDILEVHLFQFEGNLYGKTIDVTLIKHLRPSLKFKSQEQLQAQIHKDAADCWENFQDVNQKKGN